MFGAFEDRMEVRRPRGRAEPGGEAQIRGTGEGRPVKQEEHGAMNGALKQTEVTLTTSPVVWASPLFLKPQFSNLGSGGIATCPTAKGGNETGSHGIALFAVLFLHQP